MENADSLSLIPLAQSGDHSAQTALLAQHSRQLWKLANKRSAGTGEDVEDFYQIACIAFLRAVSKFDASRGIKLNTWVHSWVSKTLLSARAHSGLIRVPHTIPRDDPVRHPVQAVLSLAAPFADMPGPFDEYICDEPSGADSDERMDLFDAMTRLTERQRVAVWGVANGQLCRAIGEQWGITKSAVTQLNRQGLARLRRMLARA